MAGYNYSCKWILQPFSCHDPNQLQVTGGKNYIKALRTISYNFNNLEIFSRLKSMKQALFKYLLTEQCQLGQATESVKCCERK